MIRTTIVRPFSLAGIAAALVATLTACVGDKGVAPSTSPPSETIGSMHASPINVVMAVGDTFSIHPVATAIDGSTLTTFDSLVYRLNNIVDTARVSVSPTGLVTARATTGSSPVPVNVWGYKGGATAVDQVSIQIVQTAFSGAQLSMQLAPPESAYVSLGNLMFDNPVIANSTGDTVPNPQIRFSTSVEDSKKVGCFYMNLPYTNQAFAYNSQALQANSCAGITLYNMVRALAPGQAWIHANVLVFGTMLQDSLLFTLTNSTQVYAGIYNNNLEIVCPGCYAKIAPGGTMTFVNGLRQGLGMTVTYTFDNPAAATVANPASTVGDSVGNVTTLQSGESSSRIFKTPGTYHWTETVSGATPPFQNGTYQGTIVVQTY